MLKKRALKEKCDRNDCRGLQMKHYDTWRLGESSEENASEK